MMKSQVDEVKNCYLCKSPNTDDFYKSPPTPTMDGVMSDSKEAAHNVELGQLILRFCKDCGYIGNEGHDPSKISFDDYDFSNAHSPIFAEHTKEISARLIRAYGLSEKEILDIGCGDGYFLKTICQMGNNTGIGIDPGFDFSHSKGNDAGLTFFRDYYSDKYAHIKSDLIACRHVMNVINDPLQLVKTIRKNLANHEPSIVYISVPYANYTLGKKIIWNLVYEHRSWFSETSLRLMLELCGFKVLDISSCWNEEYLSIEASPIVGPKKIHKPDAEFIKQLSDIITEFVAASAKIKSDYNAKINQIRAQNKKTIAWGAGARSVSFFNQYDLITDIPYIIDINVKRQGKFLPGTGHEIVPPKFISSYMPELVVITNPTYAEEIKGHALSLGVKPEFWVL